MTNPTIDAEFQETLRAFSERRMADGMAACERLLQRADLPHLLRTATQRNQVHYTRALVDIAPSFRARRIAFEPPPGWNATNPTLAVARDGHIMVGVRLVNYAIIGGGRQQLLGVTADYPMPARTLVDTTGPYPDDVPVIISRTLLGPVEAIGDDGPFIELSEEALDLPRLPRSFANGLEDCRLLRLGDRMTITASAPDVDQLWSIRIVVADVSDDGQVVGPHFVSGIPGAPQEKNWMPFARDERLLHIYSLSPTLIVETIRGGATMRLVALADADHRLEGVRGGSPGVRLDDGWLFLGHVSAQFQGAGRTYLHRFVKLDEDLAVVGISEPFRFIHDGIEFAAGLVRERDRERLILSFGVRDAEAWVGRIDLADALAMLTPATPAPRFFPAPRPHTHGASILLPTAHSMLTPGWDGVIQPHWRIIGHTDVGPIYGDVRDQTIASRLAADRTWAPFERAWLAEQVRPGMSVVDVGANLGYFSRALAEMVGPGGRVLAIEPVPEMAALTQANLALAGVGNVELITAALGDADGVATVRLPEAKNLGNSRIFGDDGDALATTRVVRLDDILLPDVHIDVMKIDTEGMDHRVVRGALETMRRCGTSALVEFSPGSIDTLGDDPVEVLRQYAAWGYRVAMLPFEADRIQRQLGQDITSWREADYVINGREEEFVHHARRLVIMELTLVPLANDTPA